MAVAVDDEVDAGRIGDGLLSTSPNPQDDRDNAVLRKITPAGEVSTLLGTKGLLGFTPMGSPSAIGKPERLALQGNVLYVTLWNGVMKVTLP